MLEPDSPNIGEPGPWVGHYTTAEIALGHIVGSGTIRLSPYRLLRDPIENKMQIPGTAGFGDNVEAHWAATVALLKERRDRVRVLSMSRDVTSYGGSARRFGCCWARPRMWEQYADGHRGICLVFDRTAFIHSLTESLRGNVECADVSYTVEGIAASDARMIVDARMSDPKLREDAVDDHLKVHRADLFFLKIADWESEHEFRAVLFEAEGDFAFANFGGSLHSIVLGLEYAEEDVAQATELGRRLGVEVKRARWDQGRPWLVPAA